MCEPAWWVGVSTGYKSGDRSELCTQVSFVWCESEDAAVGATVRECFAHHGLLDGQATKAYRAPTEPPSKAQGVADWFARQENRP